MTDLSARSPDDSATLKRRRRRAFKGKAFGALCTLVAIATAGILATLLISIGVQGWHMLVDSGTWPFIRTEFFTNTPSRNPEDAGIMPGIWGTLIVCSVCAVSAIPFGVATAILLEEYRPRGRVLRALHGFVAINIRNLAGVPSVVYGLLGLTIFVGMFGLFGSPSEPSVQFGLRHVDEFYTLNERIAVVRVESSKAEPTALVDGLETMGEDGQRITLRVLSDDQVAAIDEAGEAYPVGAIEVGQEPYRLEQKAWYYIRLPFGRSALAGGLTLMLVVLPIVIIAASESLRAIPDSLREGALAAGATRWQMVRTITLPSAIPGIMTGSILAMSRAIGETAPIFVVGAVASIRHTPENLMDPFSALPIQIFEWTTRPGDGFREIAASAIIVLLVVLLMFNLTAVIIRQIFTKPLS